jgi:putative transposase
MKLFTKDEDLLDFERVLAEAQERHPIRILSWCIMSNHWHFVFWPKKEGDLTAFFRWLAHTDAMRWRVSRLRSATAICIRDASRVYRCRPTSTC